MSQLQHRYFWLIFVCWLFRLRMSFSLVAESRHLQRRAFLANGLASTILPFFSPASSTAAVTDETDTFADNYWSSKSVAPAKASESRMSTDEITLSIPKDKLKNGLGLELADIEFRTNIRVFVKSVASKSVASEIGIQKDWIFVSVGSQSVERTNAKGVAQYIKNALESTNQSFIELTFRDPSIFQKDLKSLKGDTVVTTQVAPAGDTTQRNPDGSVMPKKTVTTALADQRISVSQLVPPRLCTRGAATDDLLELSYTGTVVDTGNLFDGSAVLLDGKGIPGRGNDVSTFFVLGKQPFGQFPPGWDVGLTGMCVGERRRLVVPPALGYGDAGVPRRNIPPNATLQYDVTLVSLNGLATPQ